MHDYSSLLHLCSDPRVVSVSKVAVYVRMATKPGRRDDLVAAFQPFLENAETEQGTIGYSLHHDHADADALWFYTLFADEEALEAHRRNEAELLTTYPSVPELLSATEPLVEVKGTPVRMGF